MDSFCFSENEKLNRDSYFGRKTKYIFNKQNIKNNNFPFVVYDLKSNKNFECSYLTVTKKSVFIFKAERKPVLSTRYCSEVITVLMWDRLQRNTYLTTR